MNLSVISLRFCEYKLIMKFNQLHKVLDLELSKVTSVTQGHTKHTKYNIYGKVEETTNADTLNQYQV